MRIGTTVSSQDSIDCFEQRILLATTLVVEIVQVKSPNHSSSESVVFDVLRLLPNRLNVIKSNPLVAFVCVGSHSSLVVVNKLITLFNIGANLYNKRENENELVDLNNEI